MFDRRYKKPPRFPIVNNMRLLEVLNYILIMSREFIYFPRIYFLTKNYCNVRYLSYRMFDDIFAHITTPFVCLQRLIIHFNYPYNSPHFTINKGTQINPTTHNQYTNAVLVLTINYSLNHPEFHTNSF